MTGVQPWARSRHVCKHCETELAPRALACPACRALVHADELKMLAQRASALHASGSSEGARQAWQDSLALLPPDSQQYAVIAARLTELDSPETSSAPSENGNHGVGGGKKGLVAATVAVVLLVASKFKFLLLGLTKAKTFFSMFAFFGVYWTAFGWPLALGLVLGIYIHEMGHVAALRRLKIDASAPLFIPGLGAFILAKKHIDDPRVDAEVGLAGPVWGLGAGAAAYAAYLATDLAIWLAIAQITGLINLFNLIPVWQLDGSRAFHAFSGWQRSAVLSGIALAFLLTGQKMLLLVGAGAVWQLFRGRYGPGDGRALATFFVLLAALSWMSSLQVF